MNAINKPNEVSMFKVGDWATIDGHKGLIRIMKLVGEKAIVETFRSNGQSLGITGKLLSQLEHATQQEIAEGHRIEQVK